MPSPAPAAQAVPGILAPISGNWRAYGDNYVLRGSQGARVPVLRGLDMFQNPVESASANKLRPDEACLPVRSGKLRGKVPMAIKPAAAKPKAAPAAKPAAAEKKAAPAKATAAAKAAPVELITLRHLAASVSETEGLSQKQTNSVLAATIGLIGEHLKKGARIRINGLGTLDVRKRPAAWGATLQRVSR